VRRLVLIEYAYFQPFLSTYLHRPAHPNSFSEGLTHQLLSRFGRVLINPRATQNFVGERYYQLAEDAAARRLKEFDSNSKAIERETVGYHLKNLGGRMFADMAMPAFSKVVKSYWDIEDLRLAMITRLKA
jgi:hypothetical protein